MLPGHAERVGQRKSVGGGEGEEGGEEERRRRQQQRRRRRAGANGLQGRELERELRGGGLER